MIDTIRNHPFIAAAAGLGTVGVIIAIVALSSNGANSNLTGQAGKTVDPLKPTTFYSQFAKSSDSFLVNYGGSSNPNREAVTQQFQIVALDAMSLPPATVTLLPNFLDDALSRALIPTYATAFIHINHSTIDCPDQYDCRFSFYVDSPESYFDFHLYYQPDGSLSYDLTQQPLPGGFQ